MNSNSNISNIQESKEALFSISYAKMSDLIKQYSLYKSVESKISDTSDELLRKELSVELQAISDSMKFDNPIVWMLYKHHAYKDTDHPILTVGAFRAHCSSHGDICSKRYAFLRSFIIDTQRIDISSDVFTHSTSPIEQLYTHESIIEATLNPEFTELWNSFEFYTKEEKAAKWQNYERNNDDSCPCCG